MAEAASWPTCQAERDAEMKKQAALQAMMDDLGSARLDQLPLEDELKNRGHGRHEPAIGLSFRGRDRRDRETRDIGARARPVLNKAWKDAIDSGTFDDDDAAAVKDLDDLGGARLYDTAERRAARKDQITQTTRKILSYGNTRPSSYQPTENTALKKNKASQDKSKEPAADRKKASAKAPHSQPPPFGNAPVPPIEVDQIAPQPLFEPSNVVFKAAVEFLSRDITSAAPAVVFLSAAPRPEMGFFTVVIYNRKFCDWPLSSWDDYTSGADLQLGVRFVDASGSLKGYELVFNSKTDLLGFMAAVRSLMADSVASPAPAQEQAAEGEGVIDAQTNNDLASGQEAQNDAPVERTDQVSLIDFAPEDTSTVASQQRSEAAELLSTLEPYEYSNHGSSAPSAARPSREEIIATARDILKVILECSMGGETKEELAQTVEGIKSGVLDHIVERAKAGGVGAKGVSEIENIINGVFDSLNRPRRIQYTIEELMAMRHGAIQPPEKLDLLPYLPRPKTGSHETQVKKSADAMDWVLEEEEPSKPEPEGQAASSVANATETKEPGLQNSRWASEGTQIKYANSFTGPVHGTNWPKGSHLYELAELDPQAKVTSGTEDLMDFFFPYTSNGDGQNNQISQAELQPPKQAPANVPQTQSASAVSTENQRAPAAQPKLRGLAASRHSAANTPATSGKFAFHVPKAGHK
ncbi:hypothetical protein VTK56DRAFT_9236 [Thermocarpiscus australiensis]